MNMQARFDLETAEDVLAPQIRKTWLTKTAKTLGLAVPSTLLARLTMSE
jgi:hypothetical protein